MPLRAAGGSFVAKEPKPANLMTSQKPSQRFIAMKKTSHRQFV
jgi:hypothetical protein